MQHSTIQPILASLKLPVKPLLDALQALRAGKRMDSKDADRAGGLLGEGEFLQKYCSDLTALAEEGKLDPVIGRDDEIRRMIRISSSSTAPYPFLLNLLTMTYAVTCYCCTSVSPH